MASLIPTASHGAYSQHPKAAYVATADYSNAFYSYTTSYDANHNTIGTLTQGGVSGLNGTNSKAGDFLYANGKKLYPGANPGVTTYMVGVYSPTTGLSGYIDPNSAAFTPMVNGKPLQIQVQDSGSNYIFNADPTTNIKDEGQPVFTNGSGQFNSFLSTGTYFTAGTSGSFGTSLSTGTTFTAGTSGSFGTYVSTGTYVKAGTYRNSAVVPLTFYTGGPVGNSNIFLNPNLGNTFTVTLPSGLNYVFVYFQDNTVTPLSNATPYVPGTTVNLILTNNTGAGTANIVVQPGTGTNGYFTNIFGTNVGGNQGVGVNGTRTVYSFTITSPTNLCQTSLVQY